MLPPIHHMVWLVYLKLTSLSSRETLLFVILFPFEAASGHLFLSNRKQLEDLETKRRRLRVPNIYRLGNQLVKGSREFGSLQRTIITSQPSIPTLELHFIKSCVFLFCQLSSQDTFSCHTSLLIKISLSIIKLTLRNYKLASSLWIN